MLTVNRKFLFLLLAATMSAAACAGGGGGDGEGATNETLPMVSDTGDCVQEHMMPSHKALWTYLDCGPTEYVWVTQNTGDSKSGEIIGKRDINHGKITFKMTGLHNEKMDLNETFGMFFDAMGYNKTSRSFRWTSKRISSDGKILSRLGAVRYSEPDCPNGCDDRWDTEELQFWDESETYQWDCSWAQTKNLIYCEVTKVGDPIFKVVTWNIMYGPFVEFKYLGVGKNAYDGFYKSYDVIVSDFRLTLFD